MSSNPPHRPSAPTTDTEKTVKGFGTLTSREGRGVVGGKPYGEQLEDERRDIATVFRFSPGIAARARAATRRALRRG